MTEPSKPAVLIGMSRFWFWFSQITSVIGLASLIDDLKIWMAFVEWLIGALDGLWPILARLAEGIGGVLHAVISLWRSIFHPVIDILLGWLPVSIPPWVKDVVLIAIFVLLGRSRADDLSNRTTQDRHRFFKAMADRHGANGMVQAWMVEPYDKRRRGEPLRNYEVLFADQFEAALGANAGRCADELLTSKEWKALLSRDGRAYMISKDLKALVWILAGVAAVLVVLDFLFFR